MPIEHCLGVRRHRKIQRFFRHFNVTVLCLFLTILVLRGTIGAGKFGTPEQDFINIRNHFQRQTKTVETHRLLAINTDESPEPTNVVDNYVPKLPNWDDERKSWLSKNPNQPNYIEPNKPRVLLLIPYSSPDYNDDLSRSINNKIDYCRLHGIEMEIIHNLTTIVDSETETKLALLRNLLISHPEVEFIWWMDSNALFTDMAVEIPWEKYKDHNLIIYGRDEEIRNQFGSSFLLRNSQWTLDILDQWAMNREEIELGNDKVYVENNSYYSKIESIENRIKCI